jgi:DNA polymerase-3 subunit gamma/tau
MAEDSDAARVALPAAGRQSLALYRKYRPATFAEVRGQDHVTVPLRQALRSGRINHAYLFSGPRGCGKTSSARILARSLNCVNGPTPDPCGVCDSCVALAPAGPGSIDVIEIDAASHGGVDDARDLRERAFYSPVSGRYKIYIIDEAHMVTQQGFNALLKLVEEPPPHLKFIFATTEPEKVIPTIRSRTHHYPFRLMAPSVMRELAEQILTSEGVGFDPAVLPLVVRAGGGSARDTLSILDQLLAGSDEGGIRYDRAVALLGFTDASMLDEIVDAFAASDGAAVFRAVNRVIEGGHEPRRFATDMLDRFRDLIVLASVPDAISSGLLDVPPDRADALTAQAEGYGLASMTRAAEIISTGLDQMRGATSPRLLLELMCAQVLLPAAAADESSLLARIERLEAAAATGVMQPRLAAGDTPVHSERVPVTPQAPTTPEPGRPSPPQPEQAQPSAAPPVAQHGSVPVVSPAPAGAHGPAPVVSSVPAGSHGPAPEVSSVPAGSHGPAPEVSSDPAGAHGPAPEVSSDPAGAHGPAPVVSSARAGGNGPAPVVSSAAATGGQRGSVTVDTLRQGWTGVLETLKARPKGRVASMVLSNATVVSLDEGVLILRFPRQGDVKGFQVGRYEDMLKEVLQARFGVTVAVRAISGGDNPPTGRSSAPPAPPAPAAPATPGPSAPDSPAADAAPTPPPAAPPPARSVPDLPPPPPPDDDEFDPDDEDMSVPLANELTGMALVQRELGAQIIAEYDD